ncbi:Putative auto-transporter adhesin, head GIN domain [Sinomicrobium oceani]|uniref:Putative auto-transporter adhesin, head GIN domain n=1 Tax=Sinomicrobium oceani TaxID=1150368 RepID=A0A1K1QXX5_9FLAO|nr:head GIN domain-containing protein [Sinomicrobium oceani]SFW64728.1 Putative auto-transporter adhesin, head GIN domain [Sinomicrobium oceani]
MKRIFFALFLLTTITGIAQENITKETGKFDEVKVFDGISAQLIPSSENKVIISGEDASEVSIVNNNGILKVRMQLKKAFSGHKTFVEIHYNQKLSLIDVNENAFISSPETFQQINLELRAQEGGEIDIDIAVEKLKTRAVTGGIIEVKGKAKNQEVKINTGGQFDGKSLDTEQTTVNVNAGGSADVNASEYVEAKVKAGGTIKIFGNPKVIDKQTFLGGKILEQ